MQPIPIPVCLVIRSGAYNSGTNVSIGDDESSSLLYIGQEYNNKGFLIWSYNATPASAYFSIGTFSGNNPLILQSAGGNVGIGTTSPDSRLHVNYDDNGRNYLGYSSIHPDYVYHIEQTADGVGQTNIYALRTRNTQNDGCRICLQCLQHSNERIFLLGRSIHFRNQWIQLQ